MKESYVFRVTTLFICDKIINGFEVEIMKVRKIFSIKTYLVANIIGALTFLLTLFYTNRFTIISFIDGATLSTFLLFIIGWFMFISNEHTLDIFVYGVKSFTKAVFGKKMDRTYYDYIKDKDPIPKSVYLTFWFASINYGLVILILYIIK